MAEIYIGDYFKNYDEDRFSHRDWKAVNNLRNRINSFQHERDIYEFLYQRRLNSFNRAEDYRLFGIPESDAVNPYVHSDAVNRYYGYYIGKQEVDENQQKLDYFKRDLRGNIKRDKNGKAKEYGRLGQTMLNVSDHARGSALGKAIGFAVKNPIAALLMVAIPLLIVALIVLGVYVAGCLNSLGHTPFALCGETDIYSSGEALKPLDDATLEQMATPDYAAQVFIYYADQAKWKSNAVIGALSYIIQEGFGMGTFTYESYWMHNGPGGETYDKTLSNMEWLNWLDTVGLEQAHAQYHRNGHDGKVYAAIGMGLLQDSDVWHWKWVWVPDVDPDTGEDNGEWVETPYKAVDNATRMILFCEERGKSWQDPEAQMEWIMERFSHQGAWDYDNADPVKDNRTAEEWCRRVTAGIGMPAWRYNTTDPTQNRYMDSHTRHLQRAREYYNRFIGQPLDIQSLGGFLKDECEGLKTIFTGGNASIADAAVSLASGEVKISFDAHGHSPNCNKPQLATYQLVHDNIFVGDNTYASCDRAVATAVRWAGADDTFPAGNTATQYNYLTRSNKWDYIGVWGQVMLMPGDVLITQGRGHVKIYTGIEAVQRRFPGSIADFYQASYEDYFPYLRNDGPQDENRIYEVYRCTNPDKSEKYINAAR